MCLVFWCDARGFGFWGWFCCFTARVGAFWMIVWGWWDDFCATHFVTGFDCRFCALWFDLLLCCVLVVSVCFRFTGAV